MSQTIAPNRLLLAEKSLIYIACAVYISWSIWLFKERIAFSDTAAYLVHILSRDSFEIAVRSRFVCYLTQFLPYLAFKLHFSLQTIMVLYSLNFALVPIALILISMRWFRQTRTAWSMLFFYTLMNVTLFYYPVSEVQIGLGLFLFYLGAYEHFENGHIKTPWFIVLSLFFIPTIIFSHPLASMVFFSWTIFKISTGVVNKKLLLSVNLVAILCLTVKKLFFSTEYESGKTNGLKNLTKFSFDMMYQEMGAKYIRLIVEDYFLVPLLLIATVIVLIRIKKKIPALTLCALVLGWWVIDVVSFVDEHYDHYYEHLFQIIPFFVALTTSNYLLPALPARLALLLSVFILIISFGKIYNGRQMLTERMDWFRRSFSMMDKIHCKKSIFTIEHIIDGWRCTSLWSIPYETLLLSAVEGGKEYTKAIVPIANMEEARRTENVILDIDSVQGYPLAPKAYFEIANEKYCIMEDHFSTAEIEALRNKKQ